MLEKTPHPLAFLSTDFNAFLFASIGIDRVGGQLSVVSALARLDLDPWEEAEKLSRLPDIASGLDERGGTAKRLVALLPNRLRGKINVQLKNPVAASRMSFPYILIILAIILAGQVIWHLQEPAENTVGSHTIASPPAVMNSIH